MNKYEFRKEFSTEPWDFPQDEEFLDKSNPPSFVNYRPTFCEENFWFLIERHKKLVQYLEKRLFD